MNLSLIAPITESGKYIVAYFIASVAVYGGFAFIIITLFRWTVWRVIKTLMGKS